MRRITLSSLASLGPPHFSILSHKRHDSRKKKLLFLVFQLLHYLEYNKYNKCTDIKLCFRFLCDFYLKYFSFFDKYSDILSKMWKHLHAKHPLFLSDFNQLVPSRQTFEKSSNTKYQISLKSVHWEPVLFHADGQTGGRTDKAKLIVVFLNFANAPYRLKYLDTFKSSIRQTKHIL